MLSLGKVLKRLRQERDWTQQDLSDTSGVSVPTISKVESGKSQPDQDTLQKFATAFGLPSVGAIYARQDDQSRHTDLTPSRPKVPHDETARVLTAELYSELESLTNRLYRLVAQIERAAVPPPDRPPDPHPPEDRPPHGRGRGRHPKGR